MDPINNWLDNTTKKASEFLNAKIELLAFNYPNSLDVTFYLAATDRIIDLYKEKYSNDSISYFYDHVCDIIEKSLYILKELKPKYKSFLFNEFLRFLSIQKRDQLHITTSQYISVFNENDLNQFFFVFDIRGGGKKPIPKSQLKSILDRFKENLKNSGLNHYVEHFEIIGSYPDTKYKTSRDIDIVLDIQNIDEDQFLYRLYNEVISDKEMEERLDIFLGYKKHKEKLGNQK